MERHNPGGDQTIPYNFLHRDVSFGGAGFIPARPIAFNEDCLSVPHAR